MRQHLLLAVALPVTVAVGLIDDQGWPSYAIGAVLCLSLWVMLFAGSYAGQRSSRGVVDPMSYAVAAVIGIVVGLVLVQVGDDSALWSAGFIIGAVTVIGSRLARGGEPRR